MKTEEHPYRPLVVPVEVPDRKPAQSEPDWRDPPPSQLTPLLKDACEQMGMRLHKLDGDALEWRITVRTIPSFARVTLDADLGRPPFSGADHILRELEATRRVLFNEQAKHMAEHDRSQRDRLEQVEAAARALVDYLKTHGVAGKCADLVFKLMALLDAKSGAVAWRDPR